VKIGTIVIYRGRGYRFCGTTPASVRPPLACLQDLRTQVWVEVPLAELIPAAGSSQR
jgi:hypothetical protein